MSFTLGAEIPRFCLSPCSLSLRAVSSLPVTEFSGPQGRICLHCSLPCQVPCSLCLPVVWLLRASVPLLNSPFHKAVTHTALELILVILLYLIDPKKILYPSSHILRWHGWRSVCVFVGAQLSLWILVDFGQCLVFDLNSLVGPKTVIHF